jgi:peptidoglycan/xylan/chitin deacetylase (PgdA/CDA1 family)
MLFEEEYGKDKTYATWTQFFKENQQKKYNIIKNHDRVQKLIDWADLIITSVRDPRYVIASYSDFNPKFDVNSESQIKSVCSSYIKTFETMKPLSDYTFRYESYFNDKTKIIKEIMNVLGINESKIDINKIIKDLDAIKNTKYEKLDRAVTQMHPNHISPKTNKTIQERLTKEQIRFIESNFSRFMLEHGYKPVNFIKML